MSNATLTKEPKIVISNIELTQHAKERISERMGIHKTSQQYSQIRKMLGKANYVEKVKGDNGNTYLYACDNWAIHIGENLRAIITVYETEEIKHNELQQKNY